MTQLSFITPEHVREFYENAGHGRPRRSYGSTLRVFFRSAGTQGWMADSLVDAVPPAAAVQACQSSRMCSARQRWSRSLAAVEPRSTALGRRDYAAILLLAARYGLRPCDIRQLTLDDIDWRGGRIHLRQLKTGRPLVLPLLSDVAHALSASTSATGDRLHRTAPSFYDTVHLSNRLLQMNTTSRKTSEEPFDAQASPHDLGGGAFTCSATHLPRGGSGHRASTQNNR